MPNLLSKLISFFLGIVLIFGWTSYDGYKSHDNISYLTAYTTTTTFVDAVRNKGYVSPAMYNDFTRELQITGNMYDIEIEHLQKKYHPVYTDPSDSSTFQNDVLVDYDGFYTTQIMQYLFPESTEPIDSDSRRYKLNVGDYFNVKIKNTNRTNATIMKEYLLNMNSENTSRILVRYGGMVHNEDY